MILLARVVDISQSRWRRAVLLRRPYFQGRVTNNSTGVVFGADLSRSGFENRVK